jgi:hypothetical protein
MDPKPPRDLEPVCESADGSVWGRCLVERFSKVSSRDFEHELERIWDGIATVRESVVEAVRDDKLTPIEGISILACTTGQLLGYQAFHGQPQPAELLPYFVGGKQ